MQNREFSDPAERCNPAYQSTLRLIRIMLMVAALGLVAAILIKRREDLALLTRVHTSALLAMVAVMLLHLLNLAYRFLIITRKVSGVQLPFGGWCRVFVVGRALNVLFFQAGNVYRATRLKQTYQVRYQDYATSFLFFTWADTVLSLLLAFVVLIPNDLQIVGINAAIFVGLVLAIISCLPFAGELVLDGVKGRVSRLARVQSLTHGLLATMTRYGRDCVLMGKTMLIGTLLFVMTMVIFQQAFAAFGRSLGLGELAVFVALLNLTTVFVITPGNLGLRELAFGIVGEAMGVGVAEAMLAGLLVRVIHWVTLFPMAGICELWEMLVRVKTTTRGIGE